jgi:hypothetical protein
LLLPLAKVNMPPPSKTNDAILGMVIVPVPTSPTTIESSSSSSSSSSFDRSQHLPPAPPILVETVHESKQRKRKSVRLLLLLLVISVATATAALALVLAVRIANNKSNQNIADSSTDIQGPYPSVILSPTLAPFESFTPAPSAGGLRSTRAPTRSFFQGPDQPPSVVESNPEILHSTVHGQVEIMSSPSSSTTASAAECAAVPSPPPFEGKKGAAFTLRDEGLNGSWTENLPKVVALNPYWNYGWGLEIIDQQPDNIEFVPMMWGGKNPNRVQQKLTRKLLPHIESGKVKRLLGFNEPDKAEQSNMNTTDALESWPILESTGLPLASPSCAQPAGEWMKEFMSIADERCHRLDWIAVHWYGGANIDAFKRAMQNIYVMYGSRRPILITEFAPADWTAKTPVENKWSQADVLGFMKQALPWLEETDWISGYAWFSFQKSSAAGSSSALFDDQGDLTACGRFYASVRTNNPAGDQTINVNE